MDRRGVELEGLVGQEREHHARVLAAAWRHVPIVKGREVLVERGKQGERGLDVFTVSNVDERAKKVLVSKREGQGLVQKTFPLEELRSINTPVKTARDWFDLYYRTTGSSLVTDPLQIDERQITMAEFNKSLQGISYGNADTWLSVVETYQANLAAAKAYEKEGVWDALADPYHRDPGELNQSKSRDIGRRVIVTPATKSEPALVFQGRTYARSEASVQRLADEEIWRAYFQVETEDIPRMVEILSAMGQKEAVEGRVVDFKFLMATWPNNKETFRFGEFPGLTERMPRIAMYFRSEAERLDFLRKIVSEYHEDMREMSRKREGKARRPGADVVFDSDTGKEFRHINVLRVHGYSEDYVEDHRDWRKTARGERTTGI